MQVKITRREEITLSEETVDEVTRNRLLQLVHPGQYIREINGEKFVMAEDSRWTHGSVLEKEIRKATELDNAIFTVLRELKKF
jgi:hypothetical protein